MMAAEFSQETVLLRIILRTIYRFYGLVWQQKAGRALASGSLEGRVEGYMGFHETWRAPSTF